MTTFTVSPDVAADKARYADRQIHLDLIDGSTHSFPVEYFPRLARASDEDLAQVEVRLDGKALRWEAIDEDILVAGVLAGRYAPKGNQSDQGQTS